LGDANIRGRSSGFTQIGQPATFKGSIGGETKKIKRETKRFDELFVSPEQRSDRSKKGGT